MTNSNDPSSPGNHFPYGPKMRVVLFVKVFPLRPEAVIAQKFLGLLEQGWDVHIVCRRRNMKEWQLIPQLAGRKELLRRVHASWRARPRFLEVLLFPFLLLRCLLLAPGSSLQYLRRGWKRFGPYILHLFYMDAEFIILHPALINYEYGFLSLGCMHIKDFLDSRIVVGFRGADLMSTGLDNPDYYRQVWELADALHLQGADMWMRAQQRGCPKDKPHALISSAIDTAYFAPERKKPVETVGIPTRPYRIVSVGRLVWKKGYEYALQAVKQLEDQGIKCEYRIIGGGYMAEAIAFTCFDLGLEQVVTMLGSQPRSEVKVQLEWADVFFCSGVSEGFSNAALEAQAMALPVVCTDAEGFGENVVNEQTGYVVPRRDWRAMAEKLAKLAGDPQLRNQIGEAGRQRAKEKFHVTVQIAGYDRFYRQVLS